MRRIWAIAIVLLGLFSLAPSALADKRVALVIGNASYRGATPLANPKNDAEDVAAALKRIGFEVVLGLDLDQAAMQATAIRFARAARASDIAMFYYAGHAMQFNGVNYLLPVDVKLTDEADLRRLTQVAEIVADLQQAKNLRILVLDACRDNPFAEQLKSSIGTRAATLQRGLSRIESPEGTIVSFATQAHRTASDGSGRNSPYTSAFLRHIEAPEEIGDVFRSISEDVYAATGREQLPELSLSLIGRVFLKGQPGARPAPAVAAPVASDAERVWAVTKDTTSIAVLEDFIRQFGSSPFGSLARARIEELKKRQIAVVVPPTAPARPSDTTPKPAVGVFGVNPLSEAEERALAPKQSFKECDTCPEMVVLPAGWFSMGSPQSEREREPSEGPQHRVTISQQFAVGKFEVTVDQFAEFVKDSGYVPSSKCWTFEDGKLELRPGRSWRNPGVVVQSGWHPAVCISWSDAKAYVAWLSRKTGKAYRLLTEAEWEYAVRAGTGTRFHFGDNYNALCGYGNGADQRAKRSVPGASSWPVVPCDDGFGYTAPVGSFAANGFGLYDMHGNAWEWTDDCWNGNYSGAPTDGSAWTGGDCNFRILRGGGWGSYPQSLRAAYRFKSDGTAGDAAGFRVARSLAP